MKDNQENEKTNYKPEKKKKKVAKDIFDKGTMQDINDIYQESLVDLNNYSNFMIQKLIQSESAGNAKL